MSDVIASGSNSDWRRARYLLSFGYDLDGQAHQLSERTQVRERRAVAVSAAGKPVPGKSDTFQMTFLN